ncbi:hypothetical protein [Microseira wollei]|nr:hypothetical protein [Microseira wollei]
MGNNRFESNWGVWRSDGGDEGKERSHPILDSVSDGWVQVISD